MDTVQILCKLREVDSFLDVFVSDLLPRSIPKIYTDIVNAVSHTDGFSHRLPVNFRPKSSSAYYFDSNGIVTLVSDKLAFIKRNCTTLKHNGRQLQGLASEV